MTVSQRAPQAGELDQFEAALLMKEMIEDTAAVLVVGGIGVTVVLVVLFNLISDLTGGIRFTMIEEETAVRQRRLRRGDVLVDQAAGSGDAGHPPPPGG